MDTIAEYDWGKNVRLTFPKVRMLSTRLPGQVFPFHHVRLNQSDQLSMELHSE